MRKNDLMEDDNSAGWIMTFADLMTLLLVFFVLLFSMSNLEKEQFAQAARSFQLAFQGAVGANSLIDFEHTAPAKPDIPETVEEILPASDITDVESEKENEAEAEKQEVTISNEWQQMMNELDSAFKQMDAEDAVEIGTPKDGKLYIQVKGAVLFDAGSADFHRRMMPMLDGMLFALRNNPDYRLNIRGHTDDIPISTPQFPSNWELSAVRATTVLRYMIRGGISPERVTATGYGDSLPLVPNDTPEHRADNRRIEFVLEKVQ